MQRHRRPRCRRAGADGFGHLSLNGLAAELPTLVMRRRPCRTDCPDGVARSVEAAITQFAADQSRRPRCGVEVGRRGVTASHRDMMKPEVQSWVLFTCAEVSVDFLHPRGFDRLSRRHGHSRDAEGHLPGDQHPRRLGDLAVHRPEHAGDGAARQHLQPVLDQFECHRHQKHGGADAQRHLGAEDLFPAGRQSRSGDLPDRFGDKLDSTR